MSFDQNGQKRFSLKERYAYHKQIADSGQDLGGNAVSTVTRIRHANSAIKLHNRLNRFMKTREFVQNEKRRGK